MAHLENGKLVYDQITKMAVCHGNYLVGKDKSYVDNLIWWATTPQDLLRPRSNSTHTEIGVWVDNELWFFSSTSRNRSGDGTVSNGTRWIKATDLLTHPDRWILLEEVVIPPNEMMYLPSLKTFIPTKPVYKIHNMIERANDMIPLAYDFVGVTAGFANPYRAVKKRYVKDIIKRGKEYCSAACHAVQFGWTVTISPKRYYRLAVKRGAKRIKDIVSYVKGRE